MAIDSIVTRRFRRHALYAAMISVIGVLAGYKGILPVFRSHLMDYLDIGDSGFGLLLSVGFLPGLASGLLGGQLIDRWGPRRVIRICLVGISCGMLIVTFAGQRFQAFLLATAISGIFTAPLFIAISAYLSKLFPRNQRQAISLNLASSSIGGMMFPFVAEGLLSLAEKSGTIRFAHVLHLPFFIVGMLLLSLSFIYRPNTATPVHTLPDAPNKAGPRWSWRDFLLPRRAFLLAMLITMHGTSDTILYFWMARFLESASFPEQPIKPGVVLSGFALAYLVARGLLALLPGHVARRALMMVPGLLGGGILIFGILTRSYLLTSAGYVLGAFCWSCEYPALISSLLRHDQRRFGAALAISGMMTALAIFTGMNAMGLLIDHIGEPNMWKAMLLPVLGFPLVGVGGGIWLLLFDKPRKSQPGSTG